MGSPTLPAELLAAYAATEYRFVWAEQILCLRVNQPNPALDALLRQQQWAGGAFITNANPRGDVLSDKANAQRNSALQRGLLKRGLPHWPGLGVPDAASDWSPEPSFFIAGLDYDRAMKTARYCEQLAFVWHPVGQPTQLCLTGLLPASAAD